MTGIDDGNGIILRNIVGGGCRLFFLSKMKEMSFDEGAINECEVQL